MLLQPGLHLVNLRLLCPDNVFCQFPHLRVFAVLQLSFCHVDGALVMGGQLIFLTVGIEQLLSHLSPLGWENINLISDYIWKSNRIPASSKFRRLRSAKLEKVKKQHYENQGKMMLLMLRLSAKQSADRICGLCQLRMKASR